MDPNERGTLASAKAFAPAKPSENKNRKKQPLVAPDRKPASLGALEVASFVCGTSVMVLEMAGSRVIAPYMGTSLVVWTSLIGIIMASLSAGYWLGGVASDLRPELKVLARVILLAAVFTALMALIANPVLAFLSRSFASVYVSSVVAAFVLFTVPSVLLGMVSPFIVRLAMKDVSSSGATVGRFSALSSAGSILGTFLGGFVLISLFASGTILLLVAGTLALTALILYRSAWKSAALLGAAFFAMAAAGQVWGMPMKLVGEHIETAYNHIWIAENVRSSGRRVRIMMTDPDGAQSVMYTDNPSELVSDYTKFYDLAFHFEPDAKKILMLGGGGYCFPRHLMATREGVSIDVVEIDPGITAAAQKYFNLQDDPRMTVRHEDARIFLNRAAEDPRLKGTYDAVFGDVFGSWYTTPFHLATVEAAQRIYDLLAPDGVLISNVISSLYGPKSGVFHGIYASLASVFPKIMIFPATRSEPEFSMSRQNIMIVAFKSEDGPSAMRSPVPEPFDPETARLLSHRWTAPFAPTVPAFTDAFAPVERYSLMQQ